MDATVLHIIQTLDQDPSLRQMFIRTLLKNQDIDPHNQAVNMRARGYITMEEACSIMQCSSHAIRKDVRYGRYLAKDSWVHWESMRDYMLCNAQKHRRKIIQQVLALIGSAVPTPDTMMAISAKVVPTDNQSLAHVA